MDPDEQRSTALTLSFLVAHLTLVAQVPAAGTVATPPISYDREHAAARICAANLDHYLYSAEDHLAVVAASFRSPTPVLHPGIVSALRVSAESSCYAWWLMSPELRTTRLARMATDELARLQASPSLESVATIADLVQAVELDAAPIYVNGDLIGFADERRPGTAAIMELMEENSPWLPLGSARTFFQVTSDLTQARRSAAVTPTTPAAPMVGYAWRPNVNVICDLICGAVLMHRVAFENFMDYAGLGWGIWNQAPWGTSTPGNIRV
jgi:hypothetical protein